VDCGGIADGCTNKDISIMQSRDGSAGIPQYSVQIVNTCISECAPTNIHVYCGWFASSPPPNPNTFTRLAYNDCLVNGGRPLAQGSIVEFQYANSFMYALSFRSANFCRWNLVYYCVPTSLPTYLPTYLPIYQQTVLYMMVSGRGFEFSFRSFSPNVSDPPESKQWRKLL
jgi:hypothetical protein